MTTTPTRIVPPAPRQLLARILEEPALVAAVQSLEGRVLGKLINALGLEDSGELVALSTPEQLRQILDEDLWKSERPGVDEQFDAERFARWLEVMLEAGEEAVARRIIELPEELVTLGLQRLVLVVDFDALSVQLSEHPGDEEQVLTEKAIESSLYHELGKYAVFSRRHEGWDAVLAMLLALDRDHHGYLERLLARCCRFAEGQIEQDGLHAVLTAAETLEEDAAAEREQRRAREGFLSPSSAASFLALARVTPLDELARRPDPIAAAYFRELERPRAPAPRPAASASARPTAAPSAPAAAADRLTELLAEGEILEARAPLLLEGRAHSDDELFRAALGELREQAEPGHPRRMEELAFLANALSAGCSLGGRRPRALEAAELVVATCNLGLEGVLGRGAGPARARAAAAAALARSGPISLFRLGWHRLHELSLAASATLARFLEERAETERLRGPEREAARLRFIAGKLREAAASQRPWLARSRLVDLGAVLDPPVRLALESLLDECPTLAGSLLEATPEEPALAGRPIASGRMLARARSFLEELAPAPRG